MSRVEKAPSRAINPKGRPPVIIAVRAGDPQSGAMIYSGGWAKRLEITRCVRRPSSLVPASWLSSLPYRSRRLIYMEGLPFLAGTNQDDVSLTDTIDSQLNIHLQHVAVSIPAIDRARSKRSRTCERRLRNALASFAFTSDNFSCRNQFLFSLPSSSFYVI